MGTIVDPARKGGLKIARPGGLGLLSVYAGSPIAVIRCGIGNTRLVNSAVLDFVAVLALSQHAARLKAGLSVASEFHERNGRATNTNIRSPVNSA
jgi:hypothetical protein